MLEQDQGEQGDIEVSLHEAQMDIFQDPARFKVVAAGRRFGKSYLSAILLLIKGLEETNSLGYDVSQEEVYYVAPTFDQAKRIMWNLIKNLGRNVIESTFENTATLTLINGRRISLKGSDRPDTLRGVGLSFVVLDEFAFMKPDVWEAIILPSLTKTKGEALFIGTPAGKNHFYELWTEAYKQSNELWKAWKFSSLDNPVLPKEEISEMTKHMSTHLYRQEMEASFQSSGGDIFKSSWLEGAIVSSDPIKEGFWYVTLDPAGFTEGTQQQKGKLKYRDEHAISVVKVSPEGWYVKEIITGRWGPRETAIRLIKAASSVGVTTVGIESGSLKNAIMPYLDDEMRRLGRYFTVEPLSHGGKKKEERIIWALQGRFEKGRIFLQEGEWVKKFIEQALDFPNPMAHDDMLDSLAYIDQIAGAIYAHWFDTETWEPLDQVAGY